MAHRQQNIPARLRQLFVRPVRGFQLLAVKVAAVHVPVNGDIQQDDEREHPDADSRYQPERAVAHGLLHLYLPAEGLCFLLFEVSYQQVHFPVQLTVLHPQAVYSGKENYTNSLRMTHPQG